MIQVGKVDQMESIVIDFGFICGWCVWLRLFSLDYYRNGYCFYSNQKSAYYFYGIAVYYSLLSWFQRNQNERKKTKCSI